MGRRRFMIGLATIIFGGSGFVASGAVDIETLGSSGGQGWIRLDTPDIEEAEELEELDEDDDEEEETGEIRVQVVRDPEGNNRAARLAERPRAVESALVRGNENGFLEGIHLDALNPNAETRIGRLRGEGMARSEQEVAFMVANVGGVGQPGVDGQRVAVTLDLYRDKAMETPYRGDAISMPWAIDRERAGPDLLGERIELGPREGIGIAIVADGRVDDRAAETITRLGITVERVLGPAT